MCRRRPKNLPPIISAQGLSKRYGAAPLFQNISFTVSEADRIGVIGPNGSGKSTLLEMLLGRVKPDSGDVAIRKGTRLSYVAQISEFASSVTIRGGIESLLQNAPFVCVVVSHDRYFLENVANEMVELNRIYEDGALRVQGNYSAFLEAKEAFLHAQKKRQESLENRVHTELEWLRRGPKARATKAKARIGKAQEMIGDLAEMKARNRTASAEIDFSATNRKTKQLITLEGVSHGMGSGALFKDIHFSVTSGMRVGLVGPNGSGKTTLLRLLRGEIKPESGKIRRADGLRIVYFDQNRELDPDVT